MIWDSNFELSTVKTCSSNLFFDENENIYSLRYGTE